MGEEKQEIDFGLRGEKCLTEEDVKVKILDMTVSGSYCAF